MPIINLKLSHTHSRHEVKKTLRAVEEEKTQLAEKLKTLEHEHLNALVGLKNVDA